MGQGYKSITLAMALLSLNLFGIVNAHAEANRSAIAQINRPAFPQLSLPDQLAAGQRAIDLLGTNLPSVASWYGKSPDEFRDLMINDKTTRLDRRGRLLYIDTLSEKLPTVTAPQGLMEGQNLPLSETFKLHSKPGAKKTIYLDFNGGTLSGTAWASSTAATAPAYTIDADPAFSNTELGNIQTIWRQVAEDYAPFDVDVTTEAPLQSAITRSDTADDVFGTVALITSINVYPTCGCGGIAYVGIYNMTSDYYKPALVFHDNLSNGNKYIAEAISHEVGHNIGLQHDGTSTTSYYTGQGTGVTGWAPIMGVGYYKDLTQFSKGEYAAANQKQDDFAVAQTYGLPIRSLADDIGDTLGSAFPLSPITTQTGLQSTLDGVIETAADKDVYSFTSGSGTITIQLNPVTNSPNLDSSIKLINSSGQILAQSNPLEALASSISMTVSAGTYFILIEGVGKGDPLTTGYTDYGSVGWYRVTANYPAPDAAAPIASFTATPISGTAPLNVTLDARSSTDPNGNSTITSYGWDYGDTTSGTGAVTTKTFTTAGSYDVTLTVIDDTSRSSTTTKTIVVNPAITLQSMSIANIALTAKVQRNGSWLVNAAVTVQDANSRAVAGASVSGRWSGNVTQTAAATTNTSGVAAFASPLSKKTTGTISFTVTSVTANGYTYVSTQNIETADSLTR